MPGNHDRSRQPSADPCEPPPPPGATVIDCDDCIGPSIGACDDCVVTFLCEREPDDALVIDVAEERALRMLADADLVPRLRHVRVRRGAG
jgi:hypothetical protein